jgi:DNA-binding SARP family transcriptional activator
LDKTGRTLPLHRQNPWPRLLAPWENQLVQIGMLGPFEVRTDDGVMADVPGARLRALLIALALAPGRTVPKSMLIDWIWGENPPADAANALQRLASRLRKALPTGVVEGQTGGYRLTMEPVVVDALRFERVIAEARQEQGQPRVRLLRDALALWRGAAMQDVGLENSAAFDAAVTRLEGLRLTAMEDRFEAEVSLGQGAEVVAELTDAVAAHPLRERLVAALMRALVAAGRDADALLTYERTREALADALGVDPSPELSALRSPEATIAELLMRPPSAPGLTRACHAPDAIADTAFCLVAASSRAAAPGAESCPARQPLTWANAP